MASSTFARHASVRWSPPGRRYSRSSIPICGCAPMSEETYVDRIKVGDRMHVRLPSDAVLDCPCSTAVSTPASPRSAM